MDLAKIEQRLCREALDDQLAVGSPPPQRLPCHQAWLLWVQRLGPLGCRLTARQETSVEFPAHHRAYPDSHCLLCLPHQGQDLLRCREPGHVDLQIKSRQGANDVEAWLVI